MSTEVTTERQHWQREVVELDGLLLEVDLPGGRDAVPFARSFREDMPAALRQMLGDGQVESVVEQQRSRATGRISRKGVGDAFRRLLESFGELPFLVAALEFEGPLRASLRAEYAVDLRDPGMTLLDLADLVANLPPGCALYRATGGDMAWSTEVHMLAAVEFRLRVLAWQKTEDGSRGRNRPEPTKAPPSVHEKQAEQKRLSARAQAYLKRTGQV
jgi:hypothetical protein